MPPKMVVASDTHGRHHEVSYPDGDIWVHCGDLTRMGALTEVEEFNEFLKTLPHEHKIVVAGNHDFCFERKGEQARRLLTEACYLEDSSLSIDGFLFYGSPWQPWFFDFAFNLPRGPALQEKWRQIPAETDVLITHGPPAGVLDRTSSGTAAGCEDLLDRVRSIGPQYHLFGHIHEAYGMEKSGVTSFVNASICDLSYEPTNAPFLLPLGCRSAAWAERTQKNMERDRFE